MLVTACSLCAISYYEGFSFLWAKVDLLTAVSSTRNDATGTVCRLSGRTGYFADQTAPRPLFMIRDDRKDLKFSCRTALKARFPWKTTIVFFFKKLRLNPWCLMAVFLRTSHREVLSYFPISGVTQNFIPLLACIWVPYNVLGGDHSCTSQSRYE